MSKKKTMMLNEGFTLINDNQLKLEGEQICMINWNCRKKNSTKIDRKKISSLTYITLFNKSPGAFLITHISLNVLMMLIDLQKVLYFASIILIKSIFNACSDAYENGWTRNKKNREETKWKLKCKSSSITYHAKHIYCQYKCFSIYYDRMKIYLNLVCCKLHAAVWKSKKWQRAREQGK